MRAALGAGVLLVVATAGCRSACLDPDQPQCVERFDGAWLVAHRMGTTLEERDVRDERRTSAPVLSLRGDSSLGPRWWFARQDQTLVLGFAEAGAVGLMDQPRGVGTCPASAPRLLNYIPDDTLSRQPELLVRVAACDEVPARQDVLFTGPADFGTQVLAWPRGEDGDWDLWVSAPQEALSRGAVYRFASAPDRPDDERTIGDAILLEGDASGERLGQLLRACGDLTGDGHAELAITVPGLGERAGGVVLLTPDTLPERDWTFDDATAVLTGSPGDQAGASVRCDDDLTGDGVADLVVGAPFADDGGVEDAGAVFVVPGGSVSSGPLDGQATAAWWGTEEGGWLGASLALADVNGDEVLDIIAGTPGSDEGGEASGGLRVLDGTTLAPRSPPGVLFVGRPASPVGGVQAAARLGSEVAAADLDGDGQVEVLGAAWRADRDGLRLHAGEILGWSGPEVQELLGASAGEAALAVRGASTHQEVGRLLQVLDADGDGTPDIITTARRRAP